ncbi:MAG: FAD-dependent monooxygenase [Steroidobacteraceae bacterium]
MIYDVLIVGGGPVGATLGALLVRERAGRVLLLEREATPPADSAPELRVVALSRASERILAAAGVWPALQSASTALQPYERMHVWPETVEPRGEGALTFDAAELAEPNLGYIAGYGVLQRAALAAFIAQGGIVGAAAVQDLEFDTDCVRVRSSGETFAARLVVGADGGRSKVREAAGLGLAMQDYGQLGLVANVRSERPHERTAWQRFLGEGTLALLPLPDGQSSIVWSLPIARAQALLAAPAAEFNEALTAASASVLGKLELASGPLSFPLRRLSAPAYARERCALLGDAAHVVHPLAGQGVNLGFLDAAALAQCLLEASIEHEDLGALRVLRRYERWRKGENEAMGLAMDLFNRFLAFGRDPLGGWAARGLGFVGRNAWLRQMFATRALGLASAGGFTAAGRSSPRK